MRIVVSGFLQSKSQFLNQYGSNFEPVDGKCYRVTIQMKAIETEQYFHGLSYGTGSFAAVQGVFNRMPGSLSISDEAPNCDDTNAKRKLSSSSQFL